MTAKMKIAVLATCVCLWSTVTAESIAITGATIHTMGSSGTIENGSILITDGKITAAGSGADIVKRMGGKPANVAPIRTVS